MPNANGTFAITSMGEDALREFEGGARLTRARGTQQFSGDIEGEGSVEWLMCYSPDGSATFVGLQTNLRRLRGPEGKHRRPGRRAPRRQRVAGELDRHPGLGHVRALGPQRGGNLPRPGGREVSYRLEYQFG